MKLKFLEELHLDDNSELNFTNAFLTLAQIENLRILNLANNKLVSIPHQFQNLNGLKGVVLDNNAGLDLEILENHCQNLRLDILLLRDCQITNLPNNLTGFQNLKVFDLSQNKISKEEQTRIKSELDNTNVIF